MSVPPAPQPGAVAISPEAVDAVCGELGMARLLLADANAKLAATVAQLAAKDAEIKALSDEVMRLNAQPPAAGAAQG